jgi:TolB-like protein
VVGNIIAEQFIVELHNNGIPVVDYKVTSDVSRTATGDYVFSKVNEQVSSAQFMNYVLTGTLLYSKTGVVVNVRLVNLHSKHVVSAAKKTVPYFILDNMIPAQFKHAISMN